MFGKGMGIRVLASLFAALMVVAGARAGEELTPEQRGALEMEALKMNGQGVALYRQGKLPEATAAFEKALAMARRLYHKDHLNLAASLNSLGHVLKARGDLVRAERHFTEALAMYRRLYPKGHGDLAQSLNNLGTLLQARGNLGGAEPLYREALEMRRRLYPKGDNAGLATSLNNYGVLSHARGDLDRAEGHLRQALTMARRLYPNGDQPLLATCLNNRGNLLRERGDLDGAKEHYRQAQAVCRRFRPDGDHPDLATTFANLGVLLRTRGDTAGAEEYLRQALAMRRRLYPKQDNPHLAVSLNDLGALLQARGNESEAGQLYREALAMVRRLNAERDHPEWAISLNNLGVLLQGGRDLAGAEEYLRQALAMRRRLYPKQDHPDLAVSLNNLGYLLHRHRGDLDGAEKLYREALAMHHRLYPEGDHPLLALSLNCLGDLLHQKGNLAGAEDHLRLALAMYQRFLFEQAGLAAEAEALNFAATLPRTRDSFLSVTRGRPDDPTAYDLIWQGRSALTRIIEQRHRDLLVSRDPDAHKLGDKLLIARQRLSHLLLSRVNNAKKHAEEVRALNGAKEELERELARKLRLEVPPTNAPSPPQRLAELLPEGAAFLDCYRYAHSENDPKGKGREDWRRTHCYVAFVLIKGKAVVRVELGEAAPLERAWAAWHKTITADPPSPYAQERKAATALAKQIWDPIREKLPPGVHALYLAPDGALTQVPWAALPGNEPNSVLLEKYAFATVPHGPFLLARLAEKDAPLTKKGVLLAVGGVDYHKPAGPAPAQVADASGSASPSKMRVLWKDLKDTAPEMQRVAALAEKHAGVKARRLSGDDATTKVVQAELPKARYAHLATHGFFADAKFRSAFQVDPGSFQRLTRDRQGGARSPLALSGLVFAGANRTGDEAEDDRGIVTAEALVGLRLDKLELAVLSACNTGLGEVGGGEGVYGLQRAFHVAGCKDVVASLWEVGDQSTAALMALFYRNLWELKKDPLNALRDAQLELYRHPERIKEIARRGPDFTPRPLPKENPNPPGERAHTSRWAAFTFSGVADPARPN